MKRIILITVIALTMAGLFAVNQTQLLAGSPSATAAEKMRTANQLYETGQVDLAVQAYEQLAGQGVVDSALFYNLGNAYFKQGDPGRAILTYRRAQNLAPRDPDIEANLALARAQAVDEFEPAGEAGFPGRFGQMVRGWFTLNELAMAALAGWILFVFLLILFISARAGSAWRRAVRYALAAAAVVLVVGVLSLGSALHLEQNRSEGVVVAAEVDVTSGPGAQYITEFTLHSGAEVDLVEVRPNWVRLALPGGALEGWVPANTVAPVRG
jgi:tetratricopeptide (TPR) repeat protein